ncbi:hypothetical protein FGADI_2672 [Fusarium gaditjirri]|uniref:F-box domain-containing protein n=1 Tax=Fusarium gaditjirri TaxID=282569 RepID=A0A8H4THJ5_9HYPO|nr:hypothetical protein FGADI_2672 [Fusarium gaditjirri]
MSSLLLLPLEVLGIIGNDLPGLDLKNCSLASKYLEYGTRTPLFRNMEFAGTRSVMADELLQFLSNKNQPRIRDMIRACRSLRIEVQDGGTYAEGSEFLPALVMSAKRHLSKVTSLSLSLRELSRSEDVAFSRMPKWGPTWDEVKVFKSDAQYSTMLAFLKHSLPSLEGIDFEAPMIRNRVSCIKGGCPQLRRLRVNFRNPLCDFHRHLTENSQVKINDLENMEQLVIRKTTWAAMYQFGRLDRPIDITNRLCEIADHLGGLTALRQLSIEFHPSTMNWIIFPHRMLGPGQHHRIELDTFVMAAIMAMGARLPQVDEICLVERSAVFDGVNIVHRGVRDPSGEMAVTIEAPGYEDNFPLNISQ